MKTPYADNQSPLVVDLDGTLINTDLLYEGFVLLLRKNFLYIFPCLLWLLKGRAYLKNKILSIVTIPSELLPYNLELMDFLEKESGNGRKLVLATASPLANAIEVSKVHPIFDSVLGTEGSINLKGKKKLNALVSQFGESNFDYIGNSTSDLVIFASSRHSYLVNPSGSLERQVRRISDLRHTWHFRKTSVWDFVRAIRVHQWVKNLLVFVPLVTSHSFSSAPKIMLAIGAFFGFSLVASAGYLINDLLDLNADRAHPRKRFRPLASGKISIANAAILACILLTGGMYLASSLGSLFPIILLSYFMVSFFYSFHLKKLVLYDVFILALLYSTRIFAGGVVTFVPISFWLIAFSTFIFLSLAFAKRYSELMLVTDSNGLKSRGREYFIEDLNLLKTMGVVSGFLSVVVFSLYIDSGEVTRLYSNPKLLWAISLLFLFWISRIWLITTRGRMTDDPIIFAIKDVTSYVIFVLIGIILFVAI